MKTTVRVDQCNVTNVCFSQLPLMHAGCCDECSVTNVHVSMLSLMYAGWCGQCRVTDVHVTLSWWCKPVCLSGI